MEHGQSGAWNLDPPEHQKRENRVVPVTGLALTLLRAKPQTRGKLFKDWRTAFENAVRRAGIEGFRFHDLRHTTASYLAMQGASLLEIGAVLGHKSPSMTARYAHLTKSHTRGILQRMTSAL